MGCADTGSHISSAALGLPTSYGGGRNGSVRSSSSGGSGGFGGYALPLALPAPSGWTSFDSEGGRGALPDMFRCGTKTLFSTDIESKH